MAAVVIFAVDVPIDRIAAVTTGDQLVRNARL
jgi:hypothetical protein